MEIKGCREQHVLLEIYRNTVNWPMWTVARTKASDTKKPASHNHTTTTPFSIKEAWILTQVMMALWDSSPPSSGSVDFSKKLSVPCPNNLSFDLLACCVVSSTNLNSAATVPHDNWWFSTMALHQLQGLTYHTQLSLQGAKASRVFNPSPTPTPGWTLTSQMESEIPCFK